jgi:hypothetical protein
LKKFSNTAYLSIYSGITHPYEVKSKIYLLILFTYKNENIIPK